MKPQEIKIDIAVLHYIRQIMDARFKTFLNNMESDGIISEKVVEIVYEIVECNFVLQIINMIGAVKFFQMQKQEIYPNQFIGYSLFDSAGSIISSTNLFSVENTTIIIFEKPIDNNIIQIPKKLYSPSYNVFNLMLTSFDLVLEMTQSDKRRARDSIKAIILDYENKLEKSSTLKTETSYMTPRDQFIIDIKKAIQELGNRDINKSAVSRYLKYKRPSSFDEKLKHHKISYDRINKVFKDLETGKNIE